MPSYTVAQNASFLTVASILQRAISFVYFTILARAIGVDNTGVYFFAIAFTTIFTVIADFGLNPVITRELSRHPEESNRYISSILFTKIILGLLAYGAVVLVINLLGYPLFTKEMVYLAGVTMLFDNLHSVFYSFLRAKKNLLFEAGGVIGSQFLTMVVGGIALWLHWPLYWLILAYTIPAFINIVYSFLSAYLAENLRLIFKFDKKLIVWSLKIALPFALAAFIGRMYSYSDSLIMSKMLSESEMGWWSVPYKITFAFQFIPVALTASIYPAMSSLFIEDKQKIGKLFSKAWNYLLVIVLPLAFGLMAVAKPVIIYLYGKNYLPSVLVLQILMVSLIFSFLTFVNGATLNAINRQKAQTAVLGISLIASVILNFILLPRYGIIGAAWTALASNIILCCLGVYMVQKTVTLPWHQIFEYFIRIFIPAIVMYIVAYNLATRYSIFITIPIAVFVYILLLFMTKGITVQVIKSIIAKTKVEPL